MHQGADEARLKETLSGIGRTIVVLSGKGGVGKSTVAVGLAMAFALRGHNAGLLDTDLHGPSVPRMLGKAQVPARQDAETLFPASYLEGMLSVMSIQFLLQNADDPVVWRGPLKHAVISQLIGHTRWGKLDTLVVDSPPGTGDEPLSVVQTAAPAGAVIVTTPQSVATDDVRKSLSFCKQLSLPVLGIIENMSGFVCPHCGETTQIFGSGGGERLAEEYGVPFLGRIPVDPSIVLAHDVGLLTDASAAARAHANRFDGIASQLM